MPKRTELQKEQRKIYDASPQGKMNTKISDWKYNGLLWNSVEELEGIYGLYICSERCEECKCIYTKDNRKDMDHNHLTGKFRNILCHSCNTKRRMDNTSGIPNINKHHDGWIYRLQIKGKRHCKFSKDLEWLKEYKLDYEKKNIYIH